MELYPRGGGIIPAGATLCGGPDRPQTAGPPRPARAARAPALLAHRPCSRRSRPPAPLAQPKPPAPPAPAQAAVGSPNSRAISIRWTSLVPSPISRIFASRHMRATGYSFMKP